MFDTVVYLGPTLNRSEALSILEADYLPPICRGDLGKLPEKTRTVGIIDGEFFQNLSVSTKEIVAVLDRGIQVFGAASMGALRAAELWTYGMEGIGEIFRRFQTGAWECDDEVAVIHGRVESGFRAASVALASIRLGLERACQRNLLTPDQAAGIVEELRAVFYPERCWQGVFAIARNLGLSEHEIRGLKEFVAAEAPDAKRDDALEALSWVRAWCESPTKQVPPAVTFDFEPTIYWRMLLSEIHPAAPYASGHRNAGIDYPALVRDARMQTDARELHRGSALLHLLLAQERDNMPTPTREQLQLALARFRRRRGLHTADQARQFYRDQQLTDSEIEVLARAELALDALLARRSGALTGLLALELKRRGEFAATLERVSAKQRVRQDRAVTSLALEDLGVTLSELLDWYQDRFETIEGSLDAHAEALGYQSAREFLSEVMLEYHIQPQHIPSAAGGTSVVAADAAAFASRIAQPIGVISAAARDSASGATATHDITPTAAGLPASGLPDKQ